MAPRVLVIGCGFIGAHVVAELAGRQIPTTVLTRSQPPHEVATLLDEDRLLIGESTDPELFQRALTGVDEVIYAAGGLLPAAAEAEPDRNETLTLDPLKTVLACLAERDGINLTYLSSGGTVYGEPESSPVAEDAPTEPISAYGRTHLASENAVREYAAKHGATVRILRCSTVYGEFQRPGRGQGAVVTFLDRVARGVQIDLYGGGTTIRDYVYAGDVATAICDLLKVDGGTLTLNVGSGRGTSLVELLGDVEERVARKAVVAHHPERSFDIHQIVLDIGRLRETIDFFPTPLNEGIARTFTWLNRYPVGSK